MKKLKATISEAVRLYFDPMSALLFTITIAILSVVFAIIVAFTPGIWQ